MLTNGSYKIDKATSTTVVTGGTFTYDGNPHPATVSVTGAGGLNLTPAPSYSGGCSAAPVYVNQTTPTPCTASYTYVGDDNHTSSSDTRQHHHHHRVCFQRLLLADRWVSGELHWWQLCRPSQVLQTGQHHPGEVRRDLAERAAQL